MTDEFTGRDAQPSRETSDPAYQPTPPEPTRVAAGGPAPRTKVVEAMEPLFAADECQGLRARWESLQVSFVDEPRRAVEQADELVNQTVEGLSRLFANERDRLEKQWHTGENVSTEDLRQALRRYRSFFDRLLSI
jgi:hypothetical protein